MFTFAAAKKSLKNQKGFSLVELMVVVAIIGVLSAIGVPAMQKYIAKARQSEAKSNLSGIYTAEKAFFSEYNVFDSRFEAIGFNPEGNLRYNIGFSAAGAQAGAGNGYNPTVAPAANFAAVGYCGAAGVIANGCTMLLGADGAAPPAITAGLTVLAGGGVPATFTAQAIGNIRGVGNDTWTINESKFLVNTVDGVN